MYADPERCPDCSAALDGRDRCPTCGIALDTPEAARLWQALLAVDSLVLQARAATDRVRTPVSAGTVPVTPSAASPGSMTTGLPQAPDPHGVAGPRPAPTPAPPPTGGWSAGGIVLGLGATCLIVAGIIFVGVAWGSLGVGGRAAVLLGVTALFGGLAVLATRRGLRGSGEALWAVTLGLVAVDWFAAVGFDLLGLGGLSAAQSATTWSIVMAGVAAGVTHGLRTAGTPDLVVPSVVAGLAVWVLAVAVPVAILEAASPSASVVTALGLAAAAGGWTALRALGLRVGAAIALTAVATTAVVVVLTAAVEACLHPSVGELASGRGVPLLVVAVVLLAAGVRLARRHAPLATAAAALGALALVLLVCLPVQRAWPDGGVVAPVAVVAVTATWLSRTGRPLSVAGRLVGGVAAALLAIEALRWVVDTILLLDRLVAPSTTPAWGDRLRVLDPFAAAWPAWSALVVTAGLVLSVVGVARWTVTDEVRRQVRPVATWLAAAGLFLATVAARPTLLLLVIVLAALTAGLLGVLHRTPGWRWTAVAAIGLAPVVGVAIPSVLVVLASVGVVCLLVVSPRGDILWQRLSAGTASIWIAFGLLAVRELLELSRTVTGVAEAAWVALLLLVAALLRGRGQREGIEIAAVLPALLAVGVGSPTPGSAALVLTILGASLVTAGLVVADRRLLVVPGTLALGAAYVLRLVASDVSLVEAYALPFAALLLASGAWTMRRDERGSALLAPGLTLALVPSLVLVLDDPVSLRGLVLGLAAVAIVLLGIVRRWQWPFVIGSVVTAAIVIRHLGPQAMGLPRWVLIAVVGALLLGIGVTWDRRVRDGRAAIRFVTSLR